MPPATAPAATGNPGPAPVVAATNNGSTSGIDTTYFKLPSESVDQYNTRIASYNASKQNINAPSEPAVISSSSVDDEISGAQAKLGTMSQKGTTVDGNGNAYYADGSMVPPAPDGAVYNPDTQQYEPADKSSNDVSDFYGDGTSQNPGSADYQAVMKMFAPIMASTDANTVTQIASIKDQYQQLFAQQQQIDDQAARTSNNALLNSGVSRYAPISALGLIHTTMSLGLSNISNLESKEDAAIASAQQAQSDGDYKTMTDALTMAENVRQAKQTAAAALSDKISTANQALFTQRQQTMKDNAIATLVQQGITDPSEILTNLQSAGVDATSADVSGTLKNIADALDTTTANLTGDTKNFVALKQANQLPSDIAALPAGQQLAAYIEMVHDAERAPAAPGKTGSDVYVQSGTLTYTNEDFSADSKQLNASRGSDGYVDPSMYQQLFQNWLDSGGSLEDFTKTYPPKDYVNPANTWLPHYLMPASSGSASASAGAQTP